VLRTAVVVSDAAGGRRTVARAVLRGTTSSPRGRAGRVLTDVATAPERIAWSELRLRGRSAHAVVTVASAATGRVVARRTTFRVVRDDVGALRSQVAVTSLGELAWTTARSALLVARPGAAIERVAPYASAPAIEDDRTLRWRTGSAMAFRDLRPAAGPGCPVRSRFAPAGGAGDVVLTRATYGPRSAVVVVRACAPALGLDPVVAVGEQAGHGDGFGVAALAAAGGRLLLVTRTDDRYAPCTGQAVQVADLTRSPAPAPAAEVPCDRIRDVAVVDGAVTWTNDGAPRRIAP
jgi:hypothetical protein